MNYFAPSFVVATSRQVRSIRYDASDKLGTNLTACVRIKTHARHRRRVQNPNDHAGVAKLDDGAGIVADSSEFSFLHQLST